MKKITFIFKEDGKIQTDAEGFTGDTCIKETEKLLATLEPELEKRTLKAEHYAKTKTKGKISVRG